MNFLDWFREANVSAAELADDLGISRPGLSLILNGKRYPSEKSARKIIARTGGLVMPNDFMRPEITNGVK